MKKEDYVVLGCRENDEFALDVCKRLDKDLGKVEFVKFANGENKQIIHTNLRKMDVYFILTFKDNVDAEIFNALQVINNIKISYCTNLAIVCPDLPYSRQDKRHGQREPNTARLIGLLLGAAGGDHTITLELHSPQIEGYHKSLDHLRMFLVFGHLFKERYKNEKDLWKKLAIISPDAGSLRLASMLAKEISKEPGKAIEIGFVQKERIGVNIAKTGKIIGDVAEKDVIIVDDMVDTGGTLIAAADVAKKNGAKKVYACVTHAYMSDKQKKKFEDLLAESKVDELIITNTRPFIVDKVKNSAKLRKKITVLNIAPYMAEAIRRDRSGYTITEMLEDINPTDLYEVVKL